MVPYRKIVWPSGARMLDRSLLRQLVRRDGGHRGAPGGQRGRRGVRAGDRRGGRLAPRVRRGDRAATIVAVDHVEHEDELTDPEDERTDRRDEVPELEARRGNVRVDPPGQSLGTEDE